MTLEDAFRSFGPGRRFFVTRHGLFLMQGGGFDDFSFLTATFLTRGAATTLARYYEAEVFSGQVGKPDPPQ